MTRALLLWAGVLVALLSAAVPAACAVGALLPARVIAFQRSVVGASALDTWVVDVERRIAARAFPGSVVLAASNDGRWLIYTRGTGYPTAFLESRHSRVVTRLADGVTQAAFSADSRRLLYVKTDETYMYALYAASLPWETAFQVVSARVLNGAAWSPDGAQLVYGRTRDDLVSLELRRLDVATSAVAGVSSSLSAYQPAWSPDGAWIVFSDARQGSGDLYLIRPDGRDEHALTRGATSDVTPAWSPDGAQIAYVCLDLYSGTAALCMVDADGTDAMRLVERIARDSVPVWLPPPLE